MTKIVILTTFFLLLAGCAGTRYQTQTAINYVTTTQDLVVSTTIITQN